MTEVRAEISKVRQEEKDEWLKSLWDEFGTIPMEPETECIEEDWRGWKAGTFREDIWHWFDERHSKGVAYLMYGDKDSCEIENLVLIDNRENLELNRSSLRFSNAEFTKAGVAVAKIKVTVRRRKERKVSD